MQVIAARQLGLGALRDIFNAAYSDYLVPVEFDEATFAAHIADNDIDLGCSPVVLGTDGGPVAVALIGIREDEAWIGGIGTAPSHRRLGHGEAALRDAHTKWSEMGH